MILLQWEEHKGDVETLLYKFFNVCMITDPETKVNRHALNISLERKKAQLTGIKYM